MGDVVELNWTNRGNGNGTGNDNRGGPPTGGDDLEKRLEAVEKAIPDIRERLARVETKIDHIERTMATKSDMAEVKTALAEGFNSQTKWFIGTALAMAVIAFTAARFIPGG